MGVRLAGSARGAVARAAARVAGGYLLPAVCRL